MKPLPDLPLFRRLTREQFVESLSSLSNLEKPAPTLFLDLLPIASTPEQRELIREHLGISLNHASGRGFALEVALVLTDPRTPDSVRNGPGAGACLLRATHRYMTREPAGFWHPREEDFRHQAKYRNDIRFILSIDFTGEFPGVLHLANIAFAPFPIHPHGSPDGSRQQKILRAAEAKKRRRIPALLLLVSQLTALPHLYSSVLQDVRGIARTNEYLHAADLAPGTLARLSKTEAGRARLDNMVNAVVRYFDEQSKTPEAAAELALIHKSVFEHRRDSTLHKQAAYRYLMQYCDEFRPSGAPRIPPVRWTRRNVRAVREFVAETHPLMQFLHGPTPHRRTPSLPNASKANSAR